MDQPTKRVEPPLTKDEQESQTANMGFLANQQNCEGHGVDNNVTADGTLKGSARFFASDMTVEERTNHNAIPYLHSLGESRRMRTSHPPIFKLRTTDSRLSESDRVAGNGTASEPKWLQEVCTALFGRFNG